MASHKRKLSFAGEEGGHKRARVDPPTPVDILLHIASFLDQSSDVAAIACTCKGVQSRRDRIVWPRVQLTEYSDVPAYGRIHQLTVQANDYFIWQEGDPWTFPVHTVTGDMLPVHSLTIGYHCFPLKGIAQWPPGLRELRIGDAPTLNQPLPDGLERCTLNSCHAYNHPFPQGVRRVDMYRCHAYNQKFPPGTTHINLIHCPEYTQPLPSGVLHLRIHAAFQFNHPLPDGVRYTHLSRCDAFNQRGPRGAKTFFVASSQLFNQPAGEDTDVFEVAHCPSFTQTDKSASAQRLRIAGCPLYKR